MERPLPRKLNQRESWEDGCCRTTSGSRMRGEDRRAAAGRGKEKKYLTTGDGDAKRLQ